MTDLRVLSLGAGVQSTTLALLAVQGELEPPDVAIFADTGWEPAAVYQHLDRLAVALDGAGIQLLRVSNGDLRADSRDPTARFASVPYFVRNPDGTAGIGRRQCTSEYKLKPIHRKVRELLGAKAPDFKRVPRGRVAEQWVGFSLDEVHRVNDRAPGYTRMRYPLLDLGWDRHACQRYLRTVGWLGVVKSACIGCPFHGNRQWRDLRDNRPDEWADAVAFDQAIRQGGVRTGRAALRGQAFLHRSMLPLSVAPIDRVTRGEWKDRQLSLLDYAADQEAGLDPEDDDPDGCSPYGCRSGGPAA